ncbi:MAG: GNAT family N-acetyltransferase [Ruminococcus sp.]|nr:GNAT family N-acetyltransferase [Ruminococcus sp.]
MIVRTATVNDIPQILKLLSQVLEVHAAIRPDLFVSGTVKYSAPELEKIINDKMTPVFVAENEGKLIGHAFVQLTVNSSQNMPIGMKSLYIDDICVDEGARRMHAGKALYERCIEYAKEQGCHDVSLNVWQGNDAAESFYRSQGMKVRKTTLETILD